MKLRSCRHSIQSAVEPSQPSRSARARLSIAGPIGSASQASQHRRQQFVAHRVLQAAEAGNEGVHTLGQIDVLAQGACTLRVHSLRKQAAVGNLQQRSLGKHGFSQKAQLLAGWLAKRGLKRHKGTPSRRAARISGVS